MFLDYRVDKNILYISLNGRIDVSNSNQVEERLIAIRNEYSNLDIVLDGDKLEYISSAGLRIILRLRKENPKLEIINVCQEVYNIFEMTGFIDMITIKKAFRKIDIENCDFIAKGANGAVYRYDDETIVKVYYGQDTLPEIQLERENARKAFVLGVNTAIPYDIVRVGENYGTVTELLCATSLSKLIKENSDDLEIPVNYFVNTIKNMHSIRVNRNEFTNNLNEMKEWVEIIKPHFQLEQYEKLKKLVYEIPEENILLHGDFHSNNLMIQNNEAILFDMDTLSYGHPILELAYIYNSFIGFSEIDKLNVLNFLGFDFETAYKFFRLVLEKYFNTNDQNFINEIENKARLLGHIRMLRRAMRVNNSESQVRIENSKKVIGELLEVVNKAYF